MATVKETTAETLSATIQGFNSTADQKRDMIITEVQQHTERPIQQMVHVQEGELEDVSEEAAHAISDAQSATEQSRVNI